MAFLAMRILWPSVILPHIEPEPSIISIVFGRLACEFLSDVAGLWADSGLRRRKMKKTQMSRGRIADTTRGHL